MKRGTCKFYNGNHHNTHCDAGVCYQDVTTEPENTLGIAFRKPCIKWETTKMSPLSPAQAEEYAKRGTCEKYTEPSTEEIAEYEARIKARHNEFIKVLPLISEVKRNHKGKSWQGVVTCPVCGARLHLSHAAYNGHVWGKCETEGCVSWME